jgi:hypothetical protein
METVTVKKDDLIEVVKKNRAEHRAIFEEAVIGYQTQCLELLEEHIKRLKKNSKYRVAINLPIPEDHTADYDRALTMLGMSVHDEIEMSEHDFAQYVMDDWGWQRAFLASSSNYSAMAIEKSRR